MSFPLYILLIIYAAFLLAWLVFSLIAVYHMLRFGFKNFMTFSATFLYIAAAALLLSFSFDLIAGIDWNINVSFFQNSGNNNFNF